MPSKEDSTGLTKPETESTDKDIKKDEMKDEIKDDKNSDKLGFFSKK